MVWDRMKVDSFSKNTSHNTRKNNRNCFYLIFIIAEHSYFISVDWSLNWSTIFLVDFRWSIARSKFHRFSRNFFFYFYCYSCHYFNFLIKNFQKKIPFLKKMFRCSIMVQCSWFFEGKRCSKERERMLQLYSASNNFFMKNCIDLNKMKMFRCSIKVQYEGKKCSKEGKWMLPSCSPSKIT